MSEPDLWAALAVKPIDAEAVRARAQMWEPARRSQNLAMIVTLLIFLTVPAIYLLESFVPLLIGGPLIGGEVRSQGEVTVGVAAPAFEAKSRDGRVRPAGGAPEAIVATLEAVPNSTRWKSLEVIGGPEGIVVSRKGGEQGDWLCDLWLAERLASA